MGRADWKSTFYIFPRSGASARWHAATAGSRRPLRSCVRVKVSTVCGRSDEAGAGHEAAKPFLGFTLGGVGGKERVQFGNDPGMVEVFGVELGEPRAVKGSAEIKIIAARPFAHEADLGEIGARAAVRAAGHADHDLVLGEAVRGEPFFERSHEAWQVALALGER